MSTAEVAPYSVEDLLHELGGIPATRVLMRPAPGTATVADLEKQHAIGLIPCELIDGTLVEKAVGAMESSIAMWLSHLIFSFMGDRFLGDVVGEQGFFTLGGRLVRSPDLAYIRIERLPGGHIPARPAYPHFAPCLAVEVLSPSNTAAEMELKRHHFFASGTELFWQIDPRRREVEVFTGTGAGTVLVDGDALDGGTVLPGLTILVSDVFARRPPREEAR